MNRKGRIGWRPIRVSIRITGLVLPSLKVHCLGWTDTEEDAQDFWILYPLSELRVEAGATLLNKAKVEARREGDCVDQVGVVCVCISSRNCRMLPNIQARDWLIK